MKKFKFDITPIPAPRMVSSDRWQKRPIVERYFAYRNELRYLCYISGIESVPSAWESVVFEIPIAYSLQISPALLFPLQRTGKEQENGKV